MLNNVTNNLNMIMMYGEILGQDCDFITQVSFFYEIRLKYNVK